MKIKGLGFKVSFNRSWDLREAFRLPVLGFGVYRASGLGFRGLGVQGLGFRVQG